jgi:heme/copper-type cytochrome/quinol oxidase subunit 2
MGRTGTDGTNGEDALQGGTGRLGKCKLVHLQNVFTVLGAFISIVLRRKRKSNQWGSPAPPSATQHISILGLVFFFVYVWVVGFASFELYYKLVKFNTSDCSGQRHKYILLTKRAFSGPGSMGPKGYKGGEGKRGAPGDKAIEGAKGPQGVTGNM